jgi:YVTN family beta-propeller protein
MKSELVTFVFAASLAALLSGCGKAPAGSGYRVYVTNEASGDLTVIDPVKMEALSTAPLGKRARGIHPSADGKLIFVALSGSPFAPPGVDESTLPPADKSADGIGVFDVAQNKMLRKIPGGSDPEQFAIAQDGKLLFVSNEDAAGLSFVDPSNGQVLKTLPHRQGTRRRDADARRQTGLCDVGRRGHGGGGGHRGGKRDQEDQSRPASARCRVPSRWIARLRHQGCLTVLGVGLGLEPGSGGCNPIETVAR